MTVQNNPYSQGGELNAVSVEHVGQMQSSSLPHCWIIRFNCAKDVGKGLGKKNGFFFFFFWKVEHCQVPLTLNWEYHWGSP